MKRAALLLLLASCAGRCGAARGDHEGPHEDDPVPLEGAESLDAGVLGPARCRARTPAAAPASLIGNGLISKAGILVSVMRDGQLAVLTLPDGAPRPLGPVAGDGAPAAIALDGDGFFAALGPTLGKEQSLSVVRGSSPELPVWRATRKPDESLAADVVVHAGAPTLVWHEDGALVVRSATSRIVLPTPPGAVLESPRLFSLGAELLVLAIARVWEATDAGVPSGPVTTWEGAGEPRSQSSLVGFVVGAGGAVQLTPARGHVDAFDAVAHGELVAFVHDATGSLLRVRWNGAGEPARTTFRPSDVGSAPFAVAGEVLVYGNAAGDAIRVPLTSALEDSGRATREPSMDDARMIGEWPGRGTLLATATELFWTVCEP